MKRRNRLIESTGISSKCKAEIAVASIKLATAMILLLTAAIKYID